MEILLVIVLAIWVYFRTRNLREDVRFVNSRLNSLQRQIEELQKAPKEPNAANVPPVVQDLPAQPERPQPEKREQEPPTRQESPAAALPVFAVEERVPPPPKPKAPAVDRARIFDLEEALGANWLLKIGMAILVVGISLFLGYSVQKLGPLGKIAVAVAFSVSAILGGRAMERSERYRTFGRVLLSGGWGLAFFTAYAMRHIEATRVLQSDVAGVFVMLAVAAGMVVQSLKYRSQFVTGFAYGLAYLTLTMHSVEWQTLVAGFVLSVSIVVILRKLNWFALEIFAVAGAYATHFAWIYGRIGPPGPYRPHFEEAFWSGVLLAAYWVLFTISHFLRRSRTDSEDRLSLIALVLNGAGYVGISGYQSSHPELAFIFFFVLGLVYLGLGYAGHRLGRRSTFVLTSTIGLGLAIAAIPYKYSGNSLAILWLAECAIVLAAGYILSEIHFRRVAWAASAVLCGYLLVAMIAPAFADATTGTPERGLTLAAVALSFMAGALILKRRYGRLIGLPEADTFTAYLYAGWFLAIAATWFLAPPVWLALAWIGVGYVLFGCYLELGEIDLRRQSQVMMLIAALRTLLVNAPWETTVFGMSQRVLTCSTAAILLYAYGEIVRRERDGRGAIEVEDWMNAPAATLITVVLMWYSLSVNSVALGWAVLALALLEIGRAAIRPELRWQAHALSAAVLVRIFIANLNGVDQFGPFSVRLVTVLPLAALFYYVFSESRRDEAAGKLTPLESSVQIPAIYSYFGIASLLALLRFEVASTWVVVAWTLAVVGLTVAYRATRFETFQAQAVASGLLVLGRCAFENFYSSGGALGWFNERTTVISFVAALFLCSYGISRRGSSAALESGGSQYVFFFSAAALVTALIWIETAGRGYLTAAWALEGVIVFVFGVLFNERAFRLFALSLLLVCTAKIVALDVWQLETLQRIFAFIVLGSALVLVSFFYTRYRETWRKVLLG